MPRLLEQQWCAGIGKSVVSIGIVSGKGRILATDAGGAVWFKGQPLWQAEVGTRAFLANEGGEVDPLGANRLRAGGSVWAAWLAGHGYRDSTGRHEPNWNVAGVGPDGSIAVILDFASGRGVRLFPPPGSDLPPIDLPAAFPDDQEVQVLAFGLMIWSENGHQDIRSIGFPANLDFLTHVGFWLRAVLVKGQWCLLYQDEHNRLLLHAFFETTGYVIATGDTFRPDATSEPRIVYATHEGERPEDIVVVTAADLPAPTDLRLVTVPPTIPPVDPPKEPPVDTIEAPEHLAVVRSVIADHPEIDTRSNDDAVRGVAVNYTARRLNNGGEKPWGRKARQADGGNPNGDGLTYLRSDGRFEIIDMLSGSDGSATWDHKGIFKQGENGYWTAPGPGEGTTPPPPPPPSDLPARVTALEAKLLALANELGATQQVVEETTGWVDTLERRIAKLELAGGGNVDPSAYRVRIVADSAAASISTSRDFGHAHRVQLVGVLEKK